MTNTIEIENLNISDLDIPTDETLQEVATACEGIATSSESIATSCDNIATSCGDIAKDSTLQSTNTALGSLATDATLQATNTALGSISGSLSGFATDNTLQAVKGSIDDLVTAEGTILNTTLGAVAKDTTLQSTNTALGSLAADTTLQATNTALGSLMADTTGQDIKDELTAIKSAVQGLGTALGSDKANIDGSNIANPSAFRSNIGLNVTSGSLTNPDSHVYYSELKRTANQVILYIEMYNFTNQTETIIGSIPEAFRPSHRIMFDCLVLSPNVDALRGYARGSVTPAGNITYQNLGNYANGFASFTLTWFI